jgi:hypothetical protein
MRLLVNSEMVVGAVVLGGGNSFVPGAIVITEAVLGSTVDLTH